MRDYKSIGWVNGNANIVVGVDAVLKGIFRGVVDWVHFWILFDSKGKCFNEDTHNSYLFIALFKNFSHFFNFGNIKLFMKVEMWNSIALGHWFLHTFFVVAHWYSCCGWNWWGNCRSGWRWGLLCWWIWLFGLRWGWLVNKVFDIFLENSSVCSSSSYFVDIKAVTFDESSDVGSGKDASINIYFFNFVGLRRFRTSFLLFFNRLLSRSWSLFSIFFHDLKEKIANLANLFLFVVDFLNDSRVGGSNLSKLFIRGNICKFLKLLNSVTLLDK